jgi:hypothetical protein
MLKLVNDKLLIADNTLPDGGSRFDRDVRSPHRAARLFLKRFDRTAVQTNTLIQIIPNRARPRILLDLSVRDDQDRDRAKNW